MSKSLTTNEFINKANIIHNNKYCYDNYSITPINNNILYDKINA